MMNIVSDNKIKLFFAEGYSLICTLMVSFFALQPIYAGFAPEQYGSIFIDMAKIVLYTLAGCAVLYFVYSLICDTSVPFGKRPFNVCRHFFRSVTSRGHSWLLLLIYLISLVSYFVAADDKTRALTGTEFRPDGIMAYSAYGALFIFASGIKKSYYKKFVFTLYIAVFVAVSLIMVQQYYGIIGTASKYECGVFGNYIKEIYNCFGIRVGHFYKGFTGVFYNSNHMGYYILICSMVCTGRFIAAPAISTKIIYGILSAYSYWVLILNDTFGCYLGVLGALVIFAFVIRIKWHRSVIAALIPLMIFGAVNIAAICGAQFQQQESSVTRNFDTLKRDVVKIATDNTATPKGKPTVGSGRWNLWVASEDMIREEPLIGFGPDNLKAEYTKRNAKLDRAHNEYIEVAVSIGLPAAILYMGMFLSAFLYGVKKLGADKEEKSLIPLMVAVGYGISALFGVLLFYTACHCFIMLGLIDEQK